MPIFIWGKGWIYSEALRPKHVHQCSQKFSFPAILFRSPACLSIPPTHQEKFRNPIKVNYPKLQYKSCYTASSLSPHTHTKEAMGIWKFSGAGAARLLGCKDTAELRYIQAIFQTCLEEMAGISLNSVEFKSETQGLVKRIAVFNTHSFLV